MKKYFIIITTLLFFSCQNHFAYREGFDKSWNPNLNAEKKEKVNRNQPPEIEDVQYSNAVVCETVEIKEIKRVEEGNEHPSRKTIRTKQLLKKVNLPLNNLPHKLGDLKHSKNNKLYDPLNISSWAAYNTLMEIGLYTMVIATIFVALMMLMSDFGALADVSSMLIFLGIGLFVLGLLMWLIGLLIFNLT